MHYCTFVIIGPQGDPDALVAGALAPFDEALAVTPYREYPLAAGDVPDRHSAAGLFPPHIASVLVVA